MDYAYSSSYRSRHCRRARTGSVLSCSSQPEDSFQAKQTTAKTGEDVAEEGLERNAPVPGSGNCGP